METENFASATRGISAIFEDPGFWTKMNPPLHKHKFKLEADSEFVYFLIFKCDCGVLAFVDRFAMRRATVSNQKTIEPGLVYRIR